MWMPNLDKPPKVHGNTGRIRTTRVKEKKDPKLMKIVIELWVPEDLAEQEEPEVRKFFTKASIKRHFVHNLTEGCIQAVVTNQVQKVLTKRQIEYLR